VDKYREYTYEKGKVVKATCKECGKTFEGMRASGSLACHLYKTHGIKNDNAAEKEEHVKYPEWRMLDPKDPDQRRMIDDNYSMILIDKSKPWTEWEIK